MSRTLAKRILELNFQERDAERIEDLNAKANDGLLTAEEQSELEAYVNVGDLLAFWQSKARQALNAGS